MTSAAELKRLIGQRKAITVPGTANALFARVIQDLGYEIVYVTGAGVANMSLGVPDIGLTTVTEVSETVAVIADVISVPLIVDGDTGFGNPLNTIRTVRLFERAGAAGIQLEDQVFPKRCGHFAGKAIISNDEMVAEDQGCGRHPARWRSPDHRAHRLQGRSAVFPRRSTAPTTSSMLAPTLPSSRRRRTSKS